MILRSTRTSSARCTTRAATSRVKARVAQHERRSAHQRRRARRDRSTASSKWAPDRGARALEEYLRWMVPSLRRSHPPGRRIGCGGWGRTPSVRPPGRPGASCRSADGLIAATALVHDLTLWTRNTARLRGHRACGSSTPGRTDGLRPLRGADGDPRHGPRLRPRADRALRAGVGGGGDDPARGAARGGRARLRGDGGARGDGRRRADAGSTRRSSSRRWRWPARRWRASSRSTTCAPR